MRGNMARINLTKEKLEKVLTKKLGLKSPEFRLEREGDRFFGDVISPSFKRKPDHKRQEMIRDALESGLGKESARLVGMLLAFTPDEWNLSDDILSAIKKKKEAG
jgi:acid stress-induced BolA-like protein IbaG/YrbA